MDLLNNTGDGNPYGDLTDWIDAISRETGLGSLSDAYKNALGGINHRGLGNPINKNLDNSGIVFIVRPDLNLSYDNIANSRTLMSLGAEDSPLPTMQRAIRLMLDPRSGLERGLTSQLFENHNQPFIPLLTNNLLSLSGWPDQAPGTHVTNEGIRKEQVGMIDGVFKVTHQFDLSLNFRNTAGSPILALMSAWLETAVNCHDRTMVPYMDNIVNRRLDYTTRVYHFTLDPSRRFVQQWAATGGSFPSTIPIGAMFTFQGTESLMQSSDQLSINFTSFGADYNDPITFYEFNRLVGMFNDALVVTAYNADGTLKIQGGDSYVRIPAEHIKKANYHGTPLIHPLTNELIWYMPVADLYKIGLAVEDAGI